MNHNYAPLNFDLHISNSSSRWSQLEDDLGRASRGGVDRCCFHHARIRSSGSCVGASKLDFLTRFEGRSATEGAPTASESIAQVALTTVTLDLASFELLNGDFALVDFFFAARAVVTWLSWHDAIALTCEFLCHSLDLGFINHQ